MGTEIRQEIATRIAAEAGAAVGRQYRLVAELENSGHLTTQAAALLELLEEALTNARKSLALLQITKPPAK
jgi:ribose 1,5-bisphosphokinase PhnN